MKRVFVDIYLAYNLGDDLFLDILAKRYPNTNFTVNYIGTSYDRFLLQYDNVNRRKYTIFNKIGQRLKISDYLTNYEKIAEEHEALVFIGGSIFREESYHKSLYKDRMDMLRAFKRRDKPAFIIGANFGPYRSKEFFDDYRKFFQLCDDICFRDRYSFQLFKDLPQVRYAPDIVFQMNMSEYSLSNNRRVGFSIIDVRHKYGLAKFYNDYVYSTVKTIQKLVNSGYECYLMSFCEQEGDLNTINTLVSNLAPETVKKTFVYNYKGNLKEAISLMATFRLIIAARFHANIVSLLLGIGTMPIIYSDKTSNLLKDINCDDILINMNQLSLQYDGQILSKSVNNKADLKSVSAEAANQFVMLNQFLNN